jgi:hypothetical protein
MYLCARVNNCSSFYDFKLDIGTVPTKCCCAIQYCMIVIRNWLLNTEFLWLKCLQINLPTGATRLMQLVEQDLIFLPKFTQAVSNADTLVFCLMFCWSLFVIFFFFVITLFVLIRFLVSPLISSNVFLQSSLHYFNWKLLKHINVVCLKQRYRVHAKCVMPCCNQYLYQCDTTLCD